MTTIEEATASIVRRLETGEVSMIRTVSESFFAQTRARDRTVARVLSGKITEHPLGFDAATRAQLAVTVVLSILNGVACHVIDAAASVPQTGLRHRWAKRRLRRKLSTVVAREGSRAQLPILGEAEAAMVGEAAERIARDAGLTGEVAQQIASMTVAILSAAAHREGTSGLS